MSAERFQQFLWAVLGHAERHPDLHVGFGAMNSSAAGLHLMGNPDECDSAALLGLWLRSMPDVAEVKTHVLGVAKVHLSITGTTACGFTLEVYTVYSGPFVDEIKQAAESSCQISAERFARIVAGAVAS
ncbi:hypothetical protein NLX83_39740 [Allokutzneria sp. A3M-2-11 16]|uniref:hypothetical protein n=1 Tax=Allokutzneria sp. A3M-2-11 16 TaxID=2962043 RepID=UPI0020B7E12A|nr:hypothetical protein [Allokutzneria sp. A3M-2-11 16]MCP3805418.1 hypothetical protein [Allokutzneria sp. A3M-2-11 16]